jgi:RnfABCDGE-type electron transport complex G subunit
MATAQKESDIKAVVVVVVIAAVCAAGLALVKAATFDAIQASADLEKAGALRKVVPAGCTVEVMDLAWPPEGGQLVINPAFREDGSLCALAVNTFDGNAYGGRIDVLAGFRDVDSPDSLVLHRIYVLKHTETPGLGSKAVDKQDEDPSTWGSDPKQVFGVNFANKRVADLTWVVKQEGAGPNDVAAITASTVTSRAIKDSVKKAADTLRSDLPAILETVEAKRSGTTGGAK